MIRTAGLSLAIAAALAACASVSPSPSGVGPNSTCRNLTPAEADAIAQALVVQSSDGAQIGDLQVGLYSPHPVDSKANAWEIQVGAIPSMPPGNPQVRIYWLVDVDRCTGEAKITAQG